MNLGIFANTFKRETFPEVLDAVKEQGLSSIEMNLSFLDVPELQGSDTLPLNSLLQNVLQESAQESAERAIRMASLGAYFNMIHPEKQTRDLGLEKLELLMQAAVGMNIKVLSLCTGTRDAENMWRFHPDNLSEVAYQDCLKSMTKALELAEMYDLTLAFEPEVNLVIQSPQRARQILDDLQHPRLKIIFDAANIFPKGSLAMMEKILTESIYLLADDIILAHAKDLQEDGKAGDVAAGKGKLDYRLYMSLLKDIGFKGDILLHGLSENEVAASIKHLQHSLNA